MWKLSGSSANHLDWLAPDELELRQLAATRSRSAAVESSRSVARAVAEDRIRVFLGSIGGAEGSFKGDLHDGLSARAATVEDASPESSRAPSSSCCQGGGFRTRTHRQIGLERDLPLAGEVRPAECRPEVGPHWGRPGHERLFGNPARCLRSSSMALRPL